MFNCVKAARISRPRPTNFRFWSFFTATRFVQSLFLATTEAGLFFVITFACADCKLNAAEMRSLQDERAARWTRQMEPKELLEPSLLAEIRCCSRIIYLIHFAFSLVTSSLLNQLFH